jgi:hypothetical protein
MAQCLARIIIGATRSRRPACKSTVEDAAWADSFLVDQMEKEGKMDGNDKDKRKSNKYKAQRIMGQPTLAPSTDPRLSDTSTSTREIIDNTINQEEEMDEGPGWDQDGPQGLDGGEDQDAIPEQPSPDNHTRAVRAASQNAARVASQLTVDQLQAVEANRSAAMAKKRRKQEAEEQKRMQGLLAGPTAIHMAEGTISHTIRMHIPGFGT